VFAHSLGNLVFRYFLEWLKLEIAPKEYMNWLDKHIHAYFAVGKLLVISEDSDRLHVSKRLGISPGSPFLGATETVKATLSGCTFGLPISEVSFFSFCV